MFLKTLKVAGFKSFADRTRLEFRPGVSVVVGPNGSGKSNLVDAIHWVLGSQAPRTLRTQRMEDVIFAGTATRPPLHRAEVTVVLDNSSRSLDLDLDEVAITRRLYRDGSSEYEINGLACRLLDVTDLLSDSGVGRHQHIIINQGQVDAILNAGPEEHRAVIEEAAGILKHKLRRERAQRRLERTDGDVLRLTDIMAEIARQLRPLRRQAEAAERHQALQAEVRGLTLYLGGEDLRQLDATLVETREEKRRLIRALDEATHRSRDLDAALAAADAKLADLRRELDRDGEAAARLETILEQLRRVAQVAAERHRSGRSLLEGAGERRRDLEEESARLGRERGEAADQVVAAAAAAEEHEAALRRLEEAEQALADQTDLSAEGALAVVQGQQRALTAADERDRIELAQVERRLSVIADQLEAEGEALAGIALEMQAVDAEVGKAQEAYDTAAATRRHDQERWEAAQAEDQERRLEVAAAVARREAIAAAQVGTDPAVTAAAEAAPGALGVVTSLWHIPDDLMSAVLAGLGPWAGAVAFDGGSQLEAAVRELKQKTPGGLGTVRVRDKVRASAQGRSRPALVDLIGASDSELAVSLLGDVVVAEDWADAWAFIEQHPDLRAVTREGDLVTIDGIRLGHSPVDTDSLPAAANAALSRAEVDLARVRSRLTSCRRQFEDSRLAERAALEKLEALEARLAGLGEASGRAKRITAELSDEQSRLGHRAAMLRTALAERESSLANLAETVANLEGEEAARQQHLMELSARRRRLAAEKEAVQSAWLQASRAFSAARERLTLLEQRDHAIQDELSASAGVGATTTEDALRRLAAVDSLARRASATIGGLLVTLRERQARRREELGAAARSLEDSRREAGRLGLQMDADRNRQASLGVREAEARVRREAVVEGLRREIDASEDEALAAPRPAGVNLAARLEETQAELRRMGPVNALAAEEYRELRERHDFMSAQLDDLQKSRAELRAVMKALDDEIQARFAAAFEEVAVAYQEYFGVLFPGGTGRMRLTDPAEPLASGVELEAQPMGKKIGNLSLLSGGERSLAALAFLFAVFKARPSPFYVLDEVEAALDDANLRRFLRLVDTFRRESQLVLVTHQQQTMNAGDVLYGVTMEPGGSSQVLSRDLSTLSV